MNPVERIVRYGAVLTSLGRLKQLTDSLAASGSTLDLIRESFRFCNGFLSPVQVEEEIRLLIEEVRALRPATVLEIGTSMGGTLFLWCRIADPGALVISVDLPGGKFGGGYSRLRTPVYKRFPQPGQTLHLMRANSHAPETFAAVRERLNGRKVDFLFIDGDHTYEGVRQDWETYRTLVRPGGLIAFHDVAMNYKDTRVKQLWDEIRDSYQSREYAYHPRGFYGIGVVTMP